MPKKLLSTAQKLLFTLKEAANARVGDPVPDSDVYLRFNRWSDALEAVVKHALRPKPWMRDDFIENWHHNPHDSGIITFSFHFCQRLTPLGIHAPVFLRANMIFSAFKDLDSELERLKIEVAEYRELAGRVYK